MDTDKVEKQLDVRSLKELETEIRKMLLLGDSDVVKVLVGTVISQMLRLDPIWLMLASNSGGGKTELVNCFGKIKYVHSIDNITVNTFASAMKTNKEAALLKKIQNGLIIFKDFTSILDMNEIARKEIMSQLRHIYDGKFVRHAGNGEEINWSGKISVIACTTNAVYNRMQQFASMGERFVIYEMEQADRKEVTKMAFRRKRGATDPNIMREHLQDVCLSYVENIRKVIFERDLDMIELDGLVEDEIIEIADFCAQARSGLEKDKYTRKIEFIPSKEMPTRMSEQFYALLASLITLDRAENELKPEGERIPDYKGQLSPTDKNIIIKIALNSIPSKRRSMLRFLAMYEDGVTSTGMAEQLGYETEIAKETLEELIALKLAYRKSSGGLTKYYLVDDWRELILRVEHLTKETGTLEAHDDSYVETESSMDDAFETF